MFVKYHEICGSVIRGQDNIDDLEKTRQQELGCFPEGMYRPWDVEDYDNLEIEMLRK